jgi:hypothetical protein
MHVIIAAYLLAPVAYYIASEIFFGTGIQIVTIRWIAVEGGGSWNFLPHLSNIDKWGIVSWF